ncbi:leucine-rich repeat domain-containing protein [Carnobacterium divergens]|uniref:leucine-rich repeat domain-containing protein n=1 Tax=Carnobacterium divergens TaxID=2748 RepID=UPI00288CE5DE|nr:leucine-rich repeat domain-containing protein [Carnobacterium divergens]MDT2012594.1 leucine-rich repeat domain-containing protein [Carnobacterium divergens]
MKKIKIVVVCILLFSILVHIGIPVQAIAEAMTTEELKRDNRNNLVDDETNTTKAPIEKDNTDKMIDSEEVEREELSTEVIPTKEELSEYSTITGSKRIDAIFPDANLAIVVAQTLGYGTNTTRTVRQSTLNTITTLSAASIKVSSIEGIQYLNGATNISFENSLNVADLSPLKGANLNKLKKLYLKNNNIRDLTPLATAGLTSLEELYVEDNKLTNLTGIENILTLKSLSFQNTGDTGNAINSLKAVSKLINLQKIWGKSNNVTSLQPLENLSKLTDVFIESNELTSISGMENKPNLVNFSIMYQQVKDLTPIVNSTDLVNLYIRENQISDVEPLRKMLKLNTLLMESNHVVDISPLINLTNLTLFLATNQTCTLSKVDYSRLVPFDLKNIVKTRNGDLVNPSGISDNGVYKSPLIQWDLSEGKTEVSYTWETTSPDLGDFSGIVIQPVTEKKSVDFTITNTILNNPNTSEITEYTIKMTTDDGEVILPSKNDLAVIETDSTTGTFSLENGESITLKGLPETTYTVVEKIDTTYYHSQYSSIHDTENLTNQPLPSSKSISNRLSATENRLDFINKYKSKMVIGNYFSPSEAINSAMYDIFFTYPDGSTSEAHYTDVSLTEGQTFEEMVEVGTSYQVVQREVNGYEPSVEVTEEGQKQTRKFGEIGGKLSVSGIIGVEENKLVFENVKTEQMEITTKDTSKYPNINQMFDYTMTLSKLDQAEGAKYTADKYIGDSFVESYEVVLGQSSLNVRLKEGERLVFPTLPIDIQYSIEQKGVSSYLPTIFDSTNSGIITGGGLSNGIQIVGNMSTGGNQLTFTNHSEYIPPATGISQNEFISWLLIFIAIVCLVSYLFQKQIRHLTKNK